MPVLDTTGATVRVSVTEPTTNVGGSALTDLAKTRVFYKTTSTGTESSVDINASRPTGGGVVTADVRATVLPGENKTFFAQAIAINVPGGQSARSAATSLVIDRTVVALIPSAPGPVTLA